MNTENTMSLILMTDALFISITSILTLAMIIYLLFIVYQRGNSRTLMLFAGIVIALISIPNFLVTEQSVLWNFYFALQPTFLMIISVEIFVLTMHLYPHKNSVMRRGKTINPA